MMPLTIGFTLHRSKRVAGYSQASLNIDIRRRSNLTIKRAFTQAKQNERKHKTIKGDICLTSMNKG